MNVVLIGMPGAGKSRLGREVARLVGRRFIDTDKAVRDRYGSISALIEREGEDFFRRAERQEIRRAAAADKAVISTGGGAILDAENVAVLKKNGKFIYLKAGLDVLNVRSFLTARPLLKESGALEKLYAKRAPLYEKYADAVFDVDRDDVPNKVRALAKIIERLTEQV